MNNDERQMIDGLFGRLRDAERTAPPRDGDAETFIRDRITDQPGAPYYMAQTIIVQEQALEAAQARIQELESSGSRTAGSTGGGGLLGSLFGGGSSQREPARRPAAAAPGYGRAAPGEASANSPWGGRGGAQQPSRGGGFLAGAAQTAVGVAGGMMLGSMLGGMFGGGADEAQAGEMDPGADAGAEDMGAADGGGMDDFGDFDF